jgi:membrane-bound lytic murein transglycosylase D
MSDRSTGRCYLVMLCMTLALHPAFATDALPGQIPGDTEDALAAAVSTALSLEKPVQEDADAIRRPVRAVPNPAPSWEHHAGPELHTLPLPYGDAQFKRYQAAYLSPGGMQWLEAVYERSRPYAAYVQERIRYYGVPDELFFLPFIESEYSPKAVSRSGASGLWQFMRNSVGGYNMRIDDWIDERRDFMKSTDGALRKLHSNYEHFGDWLLAIASYNCGVGAMDRAIKASGGVRDYWALRDMGVLPKETALYVPKLLAIASIAMHGGRNGLRVSWTPSIDWVRIPLDRPIDIGMLASTVGIPLDMVRTGNPELRYAVTPPDASYALKVPAEHETAVRTVLADKKILMSVYMHVVKSGDTISALATYYEVPVSMIARVNQGLNPDRIRIGQTIVIPAFKDKKPYVAPEVPQGDDLAFDGRYVIAKGDTLWSLSLKYGVQPEVLAAKNGMNLSSILHEGLALVVPILE